jgi:NADH-quinone oxidoreductase subunit N
MTIADLYSILPLIIVSGAAIVLMLLIAAKRKHFLTYFLTLVTYALAFISLSYILPVLPYEISTIVLIDRYAVFFQLLIFASGFALSVFSYDYLKKYTENKEEFYILLLLATLGASILMTSQHFITFFLGLELLSVSLYGMIAYTRSHGKSIEAGVKYLILAAVSSAFLLFGMALIYAGTGTMNFYEIGVRLMEAVTIPVYLYMGFAMLIGGIAFKLALAPFHLWTPDVYQGASAPVTGFIASISKGAVFALVLRFFNIIELQQFPTILFFFVVISVISMFAGNLLALMQKNIKRLLAYSSIAHLGYLLIALIAGEKMGMEAASFYLLAYMITIIGAFGVVSAFSNERREEENISNYKGLFWKHPFLSVVFTGMLLSLAGIPLTAGFLGKFYVALAGIEAGRIGLIIILVVNSVIGLYYYLKVIVAMFSGDEKTKETPVEQPVFSLRSLVILSLLLVLLVWFGVFPQGMIAFIQRFVVL